MKKLVFLFSAVLICSILFTASLLSINGCSGDEEVVPPPQDTFDIVGVWEVTEIEGAGPVDGSNSTWTFKSDGNYTWFLILDIRNFNAAGDYNLDGKALYCEVFGALGLPSTVNITTSEHTFSFLDGDGDRWTYSRVQ